VQVISSGGTGTVTNLIASAVTDYDGTVETMHGMQIIESGVGNVTTLNGGEQLVSGGTGTVAVLSDGWQLVNSGTGSVATMSGGTQLVSSGMGSVDVMTGGAQMVHSGGTGTITTMNGGVQQAGEVDLYGTQFAGGVVSITTMNDGAQILSSGGTGTIGAMNSGSQDINSGAVGTVTNLMGGTQNVFEGGLAQSTTLNGGLQNVTSGGSAVGTTINSGTQLLQEGSYSDNTTLNEEGTIQLDVNTSSTVTVSVGTINAHDGNIVLGTGDGETASKVGNVLNIAQLNGSANFTVNTDIASGNSDKINIASATNSTQNTLDINYDPIYDASGKNAAQNTNIKVISAPAAVKFFAVTTEQGGISFTPGLTQNADGTWSITGISAVKGASQNTLTAAASYQVINEAWFDTVNSLSKRLGDLRQSQVCLAEGQTGKTYLPSGVKPDATADDGIWARYQRSTTRAGRGNKAELNANLMQVGYDKAFARKDGTAYVGIAVDHLSGGSEYETGSGTASGTSVALYNTWLGNKGHYYDVILRQGHFSDDYHLTDLAGTFSSADYGVNATTLSGEYGWRKNYAGGRYLEPQAEIIYGHLTGTDYHTSTGWPVHVDGVNHFITRVGVALGQSTNRGSYYFKTSYYHDFGGAAGSVTFGDYNYSRTALRDWAELTLGGDVKLAKNTQVYGELTKYLGDLTNNLNVNVGVRFSF
jgi:outer membrane autotransporter protein